LLYSGIYSIWFVVRIDPETGPVRSDMMKRKIPCLCDNAFFVEVPDEIDLDRWGEYLDEIMDGSFMNYDCPSCGKKHKPEFPLTVLWPGRNLRLEVLPELDRGEYYRRRKDPENTETVI
jgi:hypothetical protein